MKQPILIQAAFFNKLEIRGHDNRLPSDLRPGKFADQFPGRDRFIMIAQSRQPGQLPDQLRRTPTLAQLAQIQRLIPFG